MSKEISRYPIPERDNLPEDLKTMVLGIKDHFGFMPNVMKALAHRPAELRAFLAYNDAVMNKESGLTPAEKEMIIIAHSNLNGCTYCVMSHGAALRLLGDDPYLAEQIAVNYHEADITLRQKAMIDFAMKVNGNSPQINEEDFEILARHGFSKEDVWDIAAITAFFNMSNRLMNFLAVKPDKEFYTLGR